MEFILIMARLSIVLTVVMLAVCVIPVLISSDDWIVFSLGIAIILCYASAVILIIKKKFKEVTK